MSASSVRDPLILGGGATGELLRSVDWSQSPLGPVASWPMSLRAAVRIVLSSPQPMALYWGPELIHIYNDALVPVLGEKHPWAFGRNARDAWPEIWPVIGPQVERAMMHGEVTVQIDARVPIIRNGTLADAWWNYHWWPAHGDDGEVAGALLSFIEITTQVQARERVEAAQRSAELARQELHGIFMQAPLPMAILTGPEHTFVLANPLYMRLVGREVQGKPLLTAFSLEEAGRYKPYLDRVYHTGEPALFHEEPLLLVDEHGVRRQQFIDVGYYPHHAPQGERTGVLAIIQDVTERVVARKQTERARDVAQAANHAKDEFLATVSHELRTPLMSILGWATILRSNQDPRRIERGVEVIERNANAQARLIEDILDIARITSGKLRLSLRLVDLAEIIRAAIETVRPAATAKGVNVAITDVPSGLTLVADGDRLQQVVWNLLSNAIKFTPKEGAVFVHARRESSQLLLEIRDTGKGISAEFLPHVFERFRQDDGSSTKQHAGLPMCQGSCRLTVA